MDQRFIAHNSHLEDPAHFAELDPQLRRLKQQVYVHHSDLLKAFPQEIAGIYTLGGGRQIGKTTLLKQWMLDLLNKGTAPKAIVFLSGELIDDHHSLLSLLQRQLREMPPDEMKYVLLDEVTYIKDWDKAIKYAADAGILENTILMVTGSDLGIIREARMRFPGRRGQSSIINYHLYPLSFKEVVTLKKQVPDLSELLAIKARPSEIQLNILYEEFQAYLQHGGYLTAINDIAKNQKISIATLTTYSDWIRGDVLKRGKQEHFLREILSAIISRYTSQISWNALARGLSIDHPKTVSDYVALLESMDALFIQSALLENTLTPAPKKGKKLLFADPFIFHAIRSWLCPATEDPYLSLIYSSIKDPELCSQLVETTVITHYRRRYPTYYIKAEGEVDIAYIDQNRFWPVEIKWTNQLRTKDLKQIMKYSNGKIFSKTRDFGNIQSIPTEPLPYALLWI